MCTRLQRELTKMKRSEHFWKMKLAKCARDCSESSIYLHFRVLGKLGEWEHFRRMRLQNSLVPWFTGSLLGQRTIGPLNR